MNILKKISMTSMVVLWACLLLALPGLAEDIEETVKYKAPTMEQTLGFIDKLAGGNFAFDQSQCVVTTKMIINQATFEYQIPLKTINPSPDYVEAHLECVALTVDGYEKKIKRIEGNGDVEMKSKADICTPDRESADKLAKAIRYLIGLCGGPPCEDCDPFMWQ